MIAEILNFFITFLLTFQFSLFLKPVYKLMCPGRLNEMQSPSCFFKQYKSSVLKKKVLHNKLLLKTLLS